MHGRMFAQSAEGTVQSYTSICANVPDPGTLTRHRSSRQWKHRSNALAACFFRSRSRLWVDDGEPSALLSNADFYNFSFFTPFRDRALGLGSAKSYLAANFLRTLLRAEAERCQLTQGATITFELRSTKGRPQACDIKVLVRGVDMKDFVPRLREQGIDWNKEYSGFIKWLHRDSMVPSSLRKKDEGCGYIACKDTFIIFKRDIWVYPSKVEGFKIGDAIVFKLNIDYWWGWPTAYNVRKATRDEELVEKVEASIAHCAKCGIKITERYAAEQKGKVFHLACVEYNRRCGWKLCRVKDSTEDRLGSAKPELI